MGPLDGLQLTHQHGKSRVRVGRVWREGNVHHLVEWSVNISLLSDCEAAFTADDNSKIVATDTMKNTVYVIAKSCSQRCSMEDYGIKLAKHFIDTYPMVSGVKVSLTQKLWDRVLVGGEAHNHGFELNGGGSGTRTAEVVLHRGKDTTVVAGIDGMKVLKTTQSGFENFVRDQYTLLPEVSDRLMATSVRATWNYSRRPKCYNEAYKAVRTVLAETFFGPAHTGVYSASVQATLFDMAKTVLQKSPEVSSVYLNMPNIHFLPVNMPIVKFDNDVYVPTDEPHGSIEATLKRSDVEPKSRL